MHIHLSFSCSSKYLQSLFNKINTNFHHKFEDLTKAIADSDASVKADIDRVETSVSVIEVLNKKVLLHECKRHTACHVASAHYAALSNGGYPIQSWWRGIPSSNDGGG